MTDSSHPYASKIELASLSARDRAMMDSLNAAKQSHLFEAWEPAGQHELEKRKMLAQLRAADQAYSGGLAAYVGRVRQLLGGASNEAGAPSTAIAQPQIVDLRALDQRYRRFETEGLEFASRAAFVLVAGGLGERLGYSRTKMEIPVELTTETSYLGLYCRMIRAVQERATSAADPEVRRIPFFIMASEGTSDQLKNHLAKNQHFGLSAQQVQVFEQPLVPAVEDAEGRLATDTAYQLMLKPGGHGDVHSMLHSLGLANQLAREGTTHVVFIQDTNALIVNVMLAALGVTAAQNFDFTFVAVPRVPEEPIGALVRLVGKDADRTINVEYNRLAHFLAAEGDGGDAAGADGYSAYPGNINLLITRLEPYLDTLNRTHGRVAEFINPKYADNSSKRFVRPTRIETLMQDIVTQYPTDSRVGVALFDRRWALAAMKNRLEAAQELAAVGQPNYSALAAESGFYASQRIRLRAAKAEVQTSEPTVIHGIRFDNGPRVVLQPPFAMLLDDATTKLSNVRLDGCATLVLDGEAIELRDVSIGENAALIVRACEGACVCVKGLTVSEPGYLLEPLSHEQLADARIREFERMRGFRLVALQPLIYDITKPGRYFIGADGECTRLGPES